MPNHTADHLRSLTHEKLVELVLELEARDDAKLHGDDEQKPETTGSSGKCSEAPRHRLDKLPTTEFCMPPASLEPPQEKPLKPKVSTEILADVAPPPRPKLERRLSMVPTNIDAAKRLRTELAEVVEGIVLGRQNSSVDSEVGRAWQRLTHSNFFLPSLQDKGGDVEEFIHSKLTAREYEEDLKDDRVLNFAVDDLGPEHWLHVLRTSSDGNCLLHATLLAMWGLHDTHMVGTSGLSSLRAAMSRIFQNAKLMEPFKKRWMLQIARDNAWEPKPSSQDTGDGSWKTSAGPLSVEVSDAQLNREWDEMAEIASRPNAFLDSVHVLALAHVLRRPVIVLASPTQNDPFGQPLAPIFFRGIYLPFERPAAQCCRQPLLLCFRDAHFMPLVPKAAANNDLPVRIPLTDGSGDELPIRFALSEELSSKWELVDKYMDIEKDVRLPKADVVCKVALLQRNSSHPLVQAMVDQFVERGTSLFAVERQEEDAARKRRADDSEQEAKRQKISMPVSPRVGCVEGKQEKEDKEAEEEKEKDEHVSGTYQVRLPRGTRAGDKSFLLMPEGSSDCDRLNFTVPDGCYEGDTITIKAQFFLKGHCIKTMREVTQIGREEAVGFLTRSRGDTEVATQLYFDSMDMV